ncbi:MAG: MASE1 domain-containing protein [Lentisphaeraceae bacterium]|nr:MASE1 domain-containing protein [Lentisphaeraceae bacterium]
MSEKNKFSFGQVFLIGLVSFMVASKLGFYFAFQPSGASPFWPPAGVSLALLVIFGPRAIWGIVSGSLLINVLNHNSSGDLFDFSLVLISIGLAVGNAAEYLLGYFLLKKFNALEFKLDEPKSIFNIYAAAFLSSFPGALIGTSTIIITKSLPMELFSSIIITWWTGDFTGIVVFYFLVMSIWKFTSFSRGSRLELSILVVTLLGLNLIFFTDVLSSLQLSSLHFLMLPILFWAIFRFHLFEVSLSILIIAIFSSLGTQNSYGPFAHENVNTSLLSLQVYICVVALTCHCLLVLVKKNEVVETKSEEVDKINTLELMSLPLIICVLGLFLTYIAYTSVEGNDKKLLAERLESDSQIISKTIAEHCNYQTNALERLADEWMIHQRIPKDKWLKSARNLYGDYNDFIQAVEYLDTSFLIQWLVPMKDNESAYHLDIRINDQRTQDLKKSVASKIPLYTNPFPLKQGGKGMVIYIPVYYQGEFDGFTVGVFKVGRFFRPYRIFSGILIFFI